MTTHTHDKNPTQILFSCYLLLVNELTLTLRTVGERVSTVRYAACVCLSVSCYYRYSNCTGHIWIMGDLLSHSVILWGSEIISAYHCDAVQ